MNQNFAAWFIAAIVITIFGVVGKMDYEDAARYQLAYCEQLEAQELQPYNGKCDAKEIQELKEILQ